MKRVSIQYSIELEDLPNEVDRIYGNAKSLLKHIKLPNAKEKNILTSSTLREIDEARKKLTCLDHMLNDVAGIVGSYVEYEVAEHHKSTATSPEVSEDGENSTEVST